MVEFHAWVTVVFYSKWKNMVIYTFKTFWWSKDPQGLQILLMSGVSVTSASQILGHFGIFRVKYHNEKSQTDFPARGPGMYML